MTTENDWFMRQIKGAANMLGSALCLTIQHLDLGQFEDEHGRQPVSYTHLTLPTKA